LGGFFIFKKIKNLKKKKRVEKTPPFFYLDQILIVFLINREFQ